MPKKIKKLALRKREGKKRAKTKKPKKLLKKKIRRAPKVKVTQAQIDALVNKGEERGFVTTAEILSFMPNIESNVMELERVYDVLKERGVELREVREFLQLDIKKEKKQKKAILGK